jgi:hypothetical protein
MRRRILDYFINYISEQEPIREVRSKKGVPHFRRWQILSLWGRSVYLHCIYRSDEDLHMHNHPWDFASFILKGGYIESMINSGTIKGPGDVAYHKAKDYHHITVLQPTWTLVFASKRYNAWGYLVDGKFVNHLEYRNVKNAILLDYK